jgi:hypothetical protein
MTGSRSGKGQDDRDPGSWATETLPLSVRKELLERELNKLGFRKAGQGTPGREGAVAQQQQQPQGDDHPHAGDASATHSK